VFALLGFWAKTMCRDWKGGIGKSLRNTGLKSTHYGMVLMCLNSKVHKPV